MPLGASVAPTNLAPGVQCVEAFGCSGQPLTLDHLYHKLRNADGSGLRCAESVVVLTHELASMATHKIVANWGYR